jgi:signal transduction histidine kinase
MRLRREKAAEKIDDSRRALELEAKLRAAESNAALREQILSSMAEGVVVLDRQDKQVYANPAAKELVGPNVVLPNDVLRGDPVEFTVHHPHFRQLLAVTSSLEEGSRLVVIQDITDARRIDAMRRDFVANVSHELKTPVSGILASAETLEVSAAEDPSSVPKFVASLLGETRRLSKLVEDLLDLARLEQETPALEWVSLSEIVAKEVERIEDAAVRKKLSLSVEIQPDIAVLGDVDDLGLAVTNLLTNAVRYTEKGGVTVGLSAADGHALLAVSDTGVGIPGKDIPRIFERFYRVDKGRSRETGGTGLGLSIVKHVAETHDGEVTAKSELTRGSTFRLRIPLFSSERTN